MFKSRNASVNPVVKYVLAGILAVVGIILLFNSCTYVEPGRVGVKIDRLRNGVQETSLPAGVHLYVPFVYTVVEYPVSMQSVVYCKATVEGKPLNEEVNVNSVEGQPLSLDVSLSFELDPNKVPQLYSRFRQPIDVITHSYVKNAIRQALQEVIGQKRTADALGKDKNAIVAEVMKDVQGRLEGFGIIVRQFTLNEVRAPDSIINAIAAKNAMEQEALKTQNELAKKKFEAEQRVVAATAEAEATKVKASAEAMAVTVAAEADAKATTVKAEAQAKANDLLNKSLTPALIDYRKVDRWNGQLPQFTGGPVPFVSVGK